MITSGPAEYPAFEPWIGMTGNDPQAYGLLYDELPGPLVVYSAGNWIMSQIRVTIAAGESVTLRRRVAVAPSAGDPSATLSQLYRAS